MSADIVERLREIGRKIHAGDDYRHLDPARICREAAKAITNLRGEGLPAGWKLVPVKDTEEMWGGLARQIVMWDRFNNPTGHALHQHLKHSGREVPNWLAELIPDVEHVPPKGAVAGAIYRAMLDAAPILSALASAPASDEGKTEERDDADVIAQAIYDLAPCGEQPVDIDGRAVAAGFMIPWSQMDEYDPKAADKLRRVASRAIAEAWSPTPIPAVPAVEGEAGNWRYSINYGPEGEEDWANLITPNGEHVANIRIHHAKAIVAAIAAPPSSSDLVAALEEARGPLEKLAKHKNWSLEWGENDWDPELEGGWRVVAVRGGVNDREWTQIGFGETPREALDQAIAKINSTLSRHGSRPSGNAGGRE